MGFIFGVNEGLGYIKPLSKKQTRPIIILVYFQDVRNG